MTDVRTDTQAAPATDRRGNPQGDFIWYELMTPDPDGAKVESERCHERKRKWTSMEMRQDAGESGNDTRASAMCR